MSGRRVTTVVVVFREDVETYEFVAFWLKDGRVPCYWYSSESCGNTR
jgi:hypothetical protein